MNKKDFEEYVNGRYQSQINWYSTKASSNKNWYVILQWGLIITSSLTPILILVEGNNKLFPAFVAVAVAIMAASLKTFKFQETWLSYRTISESLKKEKYFYDAKLYEYQEVEDKEALFVERVEALISRENTKWIEIHKSEKPKK